MHANILVTPPERIARSWDTLPTHQMGGLKGIALVRAIHGLLQHACIMPMKEVLTRFVEHGGHKGNKHEASTDERVLPEIALEGQRVGDYQLIHQIGQGGSAYVYLAEHVHHKTRVALKLLNRLVAGDNEIERFQFEARLLASMRHRYIVPVVDGGWEQETPFFVMSYASKGTFEQYFLQEIPLSVHLILPTVLQMASVLQYVHNHQLVHCDVKPGNMLVGPHNEVWLSDFGNAVSLPYAEGSIPHEVRATVIYVAPEQLMGRPVPASDQYALAVMVYHWLCGHYPFSGSSMQICLQHLSTPPQPLRDHIPTISRAIEHVVQKALAKDPHQRFAHVLEFAYALKQASKAAGRTEERRKQAERRRTRRPCRW